jgi:hypothetical protein
MAKTKLTTKLTEKEKARIYLAGYVAGQNAQCRKARRLLAAYRKRRAAIEANTDLLFELCPP